MKLSYWEYKTWLSQVDFTIVGAGITGLNCALQLRQRFPNVKIVVLEKGVLPQGASTKNAGFACFGSISEIVSDLRTHSEEEVFNLVKKRWDGIQLLRSTLGDSAIDFQPLGGYELFLKNAPELYESSMEMMGHVNSLLKPIFGEIPFFVQSNKYGFEKIHEKYIAHRFEGQLDPGKMMMALAKKAVDQEITILQGVALNDFTQKSSSVLLKTEHFEFSTGKLFIATNGFARHFLPDEVQPARAQVILTKPLKYLDIKGTFHFDQGYYYFRNIDNRILFGGGRNLDFLAEQTTEFGETELIQNQLEKLLKEIILPNEKFEIERRWSGIMGVGNRKSPIVRPLSSNVFCGVRLGGMGIAIGSLVGKELAELA
ncbi:MAG: FAD-dependent oxidoreductase [Pseudozobellia sp.]|nr:FAD-dependent oxidoreductase [Pseudozobellia sp.]MBG49292.1 FAD-dependent oxidoreductase [Pseudozobellia sp.]|tara:strand:- start:1334947 stop:1336059 length:1113 start_codon:yes stop_codon:yes gene_type:complete